MTTESYGEGLRLLRLFRGKRRDFGLRQSRLGRHQELMGYLFIAPTLILFTLFTLVPIGMALFLSFTNYDVVSQWDWVGLRNYEWLKWDAVFWKAFGNVIRFSVMFVPLNIVLSLGAALLLSRGRPGVKLFRTFYYLPTVTSAVAASIVWFWLLNPEFGLINQGLRMIGIQGPAWLAQTETAMISVVMVTLWISIGSNMVIYLAGIQGIPEYLYEAARLDGANSWNCFYYITWPSLRPTTFFVSTMSIISALQIFDQAFVLTQGGPANSTKTVVYHIYQTGFTQLEMGYASAQAFVLALVILAFSLANFWVNREGDNPWHQDVD
ncbi:MAG: sugar ABC transporter permease [Firmicutes bacterium]|nr:sugar ABC transporter permease [Bacillota bacterium]